MLSWNEMRDRATKFARTWKDETRETGEYQTFWNEFFEIFGIKRRSVAIYQQQVEKLGGGRGFIDLFQPGKLIAEHKSAGKDLDEAFTQAIEYSAALSEDIRPRYIIVTDYAHMRLCDLEGENDKVDKYEFPLSELPKHIRHFAFIPGYEVRKYREQDPVNRKAVRLVVKLYQALAKSNYPREHLGHLLVRLVFCFFADNAGVFPPGEPFRYYLALGSDEEGGDFGARLDAVFSTLNTPEERRQTTLDNFLSELPYVNGGLFADYLPVVFFNREMRREVLDACEFNWSAVSPEIFGSMFQFVLETDPGDMRHDFGAHYTSEKNILKVIDGLFMDDLRAELSAAGKNSAKLNELWDKIARITLLDPACGCGNFLVVAYRELRRVELEILKRLHPHVASQVEEGGQTAFDLNIRNLSKLSVEKMYGIELLHFPAEIAKLSLWLTDHLANIELGDYFGKPFAKLPLTESPHIKEGNALTLDWEAVVPKETLSYILGNPPFLGKKEQSKEQKEDMDLVWGGQKGTGVLDYVTCWYKKAADFIHGTRIAVAFVSTNSVTQGEQVSVMWPLLLAQGIFIHFAHRTFRWSNEATGKAAVHCVIIGFGEFDVPQKSLFDYPDINGEAHRAQVSNINPYLVDAANVVVEATKNPRFPSVPKASYGSFALDDGLYTLSPEEKDAIVTACPKAEKFLREFVGGQELIHNEKRYCLWLADAEPDEICSCPEVSRRVDAVRNWRLLSNREATKKLADTPYLFAEIRQPKNAYIAFPTVSSENRNYIPIAILDSSVIASNQVYVIPTADTFVFGLLTSTMHNAWVRAVCGRLESRYRYSIAIVYNNFPWPENVSSEKKKTVETAAKAVLDARAAHSSATLADLYDPNAMPKDLLDAHHVLDRAVDAAYDVKKPFISEAVRLEFLFNLYQKELATA
jgi:hypothetical protein